MQTITTTDGVNIPPTPSREQAPTTSAPRGMTFQIDGVVDGENINGNNKWYKIAGQNGYIFSQYARLNETPQVAQPNNTDVTDELRAGTVIKAALPTLRTLNDQNQPFGNAEGAAREMVVNWNNLVTTKKEAVGLLKKLTELLN